VEPVVASQQHRAEDEAGFTLIELLVVMIIIGILASIALPTFLHQRQKAVGSGQVADLHSVATLVESYYADQLAYPTIVSQSGSEVEVTSSSGAGTQRVTVGNDITYALDPGTDTYCLVAHNPKATQDRVWVSDAGGLQPTSVQTCPF
jgi:type IV pilus assembly protein PilA